MSTNMIINLLLTSLWPVVSDVVNEAMGFVASDVLNEAELIGNQCRSTASGGYQQRGWNMKY